MPPLIQPAKTFVLVHGASHGGWCYDRVAAILRSQGHRVFAPTLAGLAERASMDARRINLTTHIEEILALFEAEDLHNAVLCGHSYGGMVIAGVADRIPDRIDSLVFLDAVVPENGKCMNDYVFPGWRLVPILISVWLFGRGYKLTPPPPAWFFNVNKADRAMVDERLTGHPFKTLTEKIQIGSGADRIPNHAYIYATNWGNPQITKQYDLAKRCDGWKVFEVESGHDVMIDAPQDLARILDSLPLGFVQGDQPMTNIIRMVANVTVADLEAAIPLYQRLAGEETVKRFAYKNLNCANIGPYLLLEGAMDDHISQVATVLVRSAAEAQAAVEEAGGRVLEGPGEVPNGARVVMEHPDGAVFEYLQPKGA
ncbi:alpha/beta fold hydrolase [Caulobacter sp. RL271]|uniref:Alpha/beta hydrolase n=1 Tax=Caulobacter segnis TaxID=88688 RepID=A0ABY4ZRT5_9CAUL|nr:alpha/beta hydrolase [Caulobacter segnis]USQ95215.1 alpha/beta hydrolase [Caulobacter segnis]